VCLHMEEDNLPLNEIRLKIPVVNLGTFVHKVYGIVSFTQLDIDNIISNFENNELGFIPYIRYGHSKYPNAVDAEPSVGRIVELIQEGPYLFAYCEPDVPEIVGEIQQGQYRYASGEFTRNDISKRTGMPIGTTLSCIALTNAPYLPDLPENQVLSENLRPDCDGYFVLDLASIGDSTDSPVVRLSNLMSNVVSTLQPNSDNEDQSMLTSGTNNTMMSSDKEEMSNEDKENMSMGKEEMSAGKMPPELLAKMNEKKADDKLSDSWVNADQNIASFEGNTGEGMTAPKEDLQDEDAKAATSKFMSKMAVFEKMLSETLSQMSSLSSKMGEMEKENKDLKSKLSNAESQSMKFSNMITEKNLSARCDEAVAAGIPAGMVAKVAEIVRSEVGASVIKLSTGAAASLEETLFEMLSELPHNQRISYTQIGQQLSHTSADNPYKAIIDKNLNK
jgi:hypothetical protein